MDKNAIKKYAVWARRELIERVSQRALVYGITGSDAGDPNAESVNGHLLSQAEKRQRQALIRNIKEKGYEQTIEEVAYTWFNRFAALRFMEVNGYLPSHIRVFTNDAGEFKPQILAEAIHLELDGLDMNKVYELESANKSEELFKYLLIVQCNALNSILPGMFQRIEDYTELLLPDYLLREGSVIEQMVTTIPEADWTDQVQIIGWLYQYYNTEPKDKVFADLKKNIKITKENIPAATQLFTPDWIVRYMVENSLGRLWVEGHPNDDLKSNWKYYLEEAEQETEVQAQLAQIRKGYAALTPEDIKVIDPCCGSGHILVYLFDVLMQIYESYGYTTREAVASILAHNLYGLDIDDRASQLSYFAVMMKARQYDRRFLTRKDEDGNPDVPQPHVYAIVESNGIDAYALDYFINGDPKLKAAMDTIIKELYDAKEYGSILTVTPQDWSAFYRRFDEIERDIDLSREVALSELLPLVQVAETLEQKYDVVVTNPPYMGDLNKTLQDYVKKEYPNSKHDLCTVFIERCIKMVNCGSFVAMITQNAFMFLSRYEKMRRNLLRYVFVNMAHLGAKAFDAIGGEVVQTSAFCMRKCAVSNYIGTYERLVDYPSESEKEAAYLEHKNTYCCKNEVFDIIPKAPITYWVSKRILSMFNWNRLDSYADPRVGLFTTDNERYLREWWEPNISDIGFNYTNKTTAYASDTKWFPYNKGGGFRRWYGNIDLVVFWQHGGEEIKQVVLNKYPYLNGNYDFVLKTENPYFQPGITWSGLTSGLNSFRICGNGFLFDTNKGAMIFEKDLDLVYLLGFLNTKVAQTAINLLNSTISLQIGDVASIPVAVNSKKHQDVKSLSQECVDICMDDWNGYETSWDFQRHPLISVIPKNRLLFDDIGNIDLAECYMCWENECEIRFQTLKANEEELNRIFIDIYGLHDELTPEVADRDVTVRKADLRRDIKSLISYAVGCMFGRYSLDEPGLSYAGGDWDGSKYRTFPADKDNIIPICDDEYFEDDIVGRFIQFIETVYGKQSLEANLKFIADALGGKGSSREVIRSYFINDFYADHLKVYQKRPIYWLFDSGKKNGFKCLIYMHRYREDTIARIRTDYVHEQQSRYRTAIADLEQRINGASTSERVKLSKQLAKLQAQAEEIRVYEEKIHHLADQMIKIDLDDGVKHNYEIFKDVLAKIK